MTEITYDPKTIPRTYRDYLEQMEKEGEFLTIDDEVDWNLEIGAILRLTAETLSPSPIFNKIKGCPGFRVAEMGMQLSGTRGKPWAKLTPFLGLPSDSNIMDIQAAYIKSIENGKVHPPKIVESKNAPCKENKWFGDDIDLEKIPAAILHDGDRNRLLQTAGLNIVQTPDGKWTNWSINRSSMIDKNTMSGFWSPFQHNGKILDMWKKKGEDMPISIALGVPPSCLITGCSRAPDYEDEYDYASMLENRSIEMVKSEHSDLMVPANSEIIIEGKISITEKCLEGPFGEYAGYRFSGTTIPKPRHDVTAVTFRNNAILPMSSPGVPIDSTQVSIAFFQSTHAVRRLQAEGFPIKDGLQTFESSGHWLVLRVKNNWHKLTGWRHDEFMNKLGHFFWNDHIGGTVGKIIVVGEDIDPSDPIAVTWAFATRNHPEQGFFTFPDCKMWGMGVEGYHSSEDYFNGGGGLGLYSCLGLDERTGLPTPDILTFQRNYPKPIREKVLANWKKWGFHSGEPAQKHATQNTPRMYFDKTGDGETGHEQDI